jgi:hypothetical protein
VGVRGSNPLSSTGKTRDHMVSGFLLGWVGVGLTLRTSPHSSSEDLRAEPE